MSGVVGGICPERFNEAVVVECSTGDARRDLTLRPVVVRYAIILDAKWACRFAPCKSTGSRQTDPKTLGTESQRAGFQRFEVNRFLAGCLSSEERRSRQDIRSALAAINDKMKSNP